MPSVRDGGRKQECNQSGVMCLERHLSTSSHSCIIAHHYTVDTGGRPGLLTIACSWDVVGKCQLQPVQLFHIHASFHLYQSTYMINFCCHSNYVVTPCWALSVSRRQLTTVATDHGSVTMLGIVWEYSS